MAWIWSVACGRSNVRAKIDRKKKKWWPRSPHVVVVIVVWVLFYLIELMDDGGRICVRRVVNGQESSA